MANSSFFKTDGTSSTTETNIQTEVDAAEAAKVAAEAAQAAAETAKTAAETAETNAETAETNASSSQTNAQTAATNAATSATAAASSATAAATSETNAATSATTATTKASEAATSATNAATSETNASTSETNASTSATNAATSATSASSSATAAQTAQTAAETAETNAETAEANAASSASSASTSASNASTSETAAASSASAASTSASNASTSATNAASSASSASTSEANASTSATNAANSATSAETAKTAAETAKTAAETAETNAETAETNAATSETNAASSASSASTSATAASNSASSASTSASNASTSATNASNSASAASTSASNASTSETNASNSATSASTSASNASTSASQAATSATNASTSATAAQTAQTAAETAKTAAETAKAAVDSTFDNFDDRFLGTFTTANEPTTDNDGNALSVGAVYYNSTEGEVRFYNGSSWDAPATSAATSATNASNSASAASTSASNAATSATNAASSESNASTSATNASNSASAASTSETNASTSATSASTSASNAATSATNAASSASSASTSESNASTSETNASNSASSASTSATNAANSASSASTSATSAASSASSASTSATNAASSLSDFQAIYRTGSSDPTTSLDAGDLFFNTSSSTLKVYTGSAWEQGITAGSGFLPTTGGQLTGNLTFSGSQTVDGRDLSVDGSKLDGIESGATADQTASEILTAVKTVDGAGSGLDADTLDGVESTSFLRSDSADNFSGYLQGTGAVSTSNYLESGRGSGGVALTINDGYGNANVTFNHRGGVPEQTGKSGRIEVNTDATSGDAYMYFELGDATANTAFQTSTILELSSSSIHTQKPVTFNNGVTTFTDYLNRTSNNGNSAWLQQDGTGRVHWYWNTTGGSSPTLTNGGGEDAASISMHTGGNGGPIFFRHYNAPGSAVAGDAITWAESARFQATSIDLKKNTAVTGNITVTGTVDGRDVAADGTKLDGIESGATADQTDAEIKTAYENNSNTNAFTDALLTKLNGIEASADVTDATNVNAAGAAIFSTTPTASITDGTNGQVLTTNGSGGLSFTTVSGGGGSVTLSAINTAVTTSTDNTNIGTNSSGGYAYNTAFGYNAGASLDGTGSQGNTLIGAYAGDAITTGDLNTAVGMSAAGSLTTGYNNCAIGRAALFSTTTGYGNVSIGFESGEYLNGTDNVAVGTFALNGASSGFTGDQNVGLGYRVLQYATTASFNVIAGTSAGRLLTTGTYNTLLGPISGNTLTTGSKNTFIGRYDGNQGGLDLRTSDNNIVLSDGDGNIRQYIDSNGRVGFATTSVGGYRLSAENTTDVVSIRMTSTNSSQEQAVQFRKNGSEVGYINCTTSSTHYGTSSDYRLKENVADMVGSIDRVKQLAPKRFNFIVDADTTVDGFLAHEAQAVVPEAVSGTHNEVDDDGNAVMQGIDQSKLVPLLTGALQEAIAKIETLETQVTDLTARVTALEGA